MYRSLQAKACLKKALAGRFASGKWTRSQRDICRVFIFRPSQVLSNLPLTAVTLECAAVTVRAHEGRARRPGVEAVHLSSDVKGEGVRLISQAPLCGVPWWDVFDGG